MAPVLLHESDSRMRARLVESLSHSFPGSALSKALLNIDSSPRTPLNPAAAAPPLSETAATADPLSGESDPLSRSCFAEIHLDKVSNEELLEDLALAAEEAEVDAASDRAARPHDNQHGGGRAIGDWSPRRGAVGDWSTRQWTPLQEQNQISAAVWQTQISGEQVDDDLTSLSWLQDADLLRNIGPGGGRVVGCTSPFSGDEDWDDEESKENLHRKLSCTGVGPLGAGLGPPLGVYGAPHPPHIPYDPLKHVTSKPPYSFSCLIFMAVEDSPDKRLPVKEIYNWILTHFPFFQHAPTGWKNSVRHNLSLNKCFTKVDKDRSCSVGKGSLWCIDPEYRPNLLQALRKTPYHPFHQLQMLSTAQPLSGYSSQSLPWQQKSSQSSQQCNKPSPDLFPFLSKCLSQTKIESDMDIDVANTLIQLKQNSRSRLMECQNDSGSESDDSRSHRRSPSPPEFGSERNRNNNSKKRRFSDFFPRYNPPSNIVPTQPPSDDHSYSAFETAASNSDSESSPVSPSALNSDQDQTEDEKPSIAEPKPKPDISCSKKSNKSPDNKLKEQKDRSPSYNHHYGTRRKALRKYHDPPVRKRNHLKKETQSQSSKYAENKADSDDVDEEQKIVEGAGALLNLAGIKTQHIVPLRPISPNNNNNNSCRVNNNNLFGNKKLLRT